MYFCIYVIFLIALQLLIGNIDETFFRAPLNIATVLLLLGIAAYFRKSSFFKKISGKQTTILSILFMIICSLIVGLTPQLSPAEAATKPGFAAALGIYNFTQSWIMAGAILLILINLILIILNRGALNRGISREMGFLFNHIGLMVVIISAFFGSADVVKLRMKLNKEGEPDAMAYNMAGNPVNLKFSISLDNFITNYYPNGTPMRYCAQITVGTVHKHTTAGVVHKQMDVEVNHPARYAGYDIYLISSGEDYCIIELQKQPWKYFLAQGIVFMLLGAITMFMRRKEI